MSLPAVADPVLAVGVVAALSFAGLRLYAWRAAKESPKTAMRRIRIAVRVGGAVTALVALFAVLLADSLDLTEAALRAASPALADSPAGVVLTWVPTLLGVTVAIEAGYLGAFPYVRDVRGLDVSAATAAWSVAKVVWTFFALLIAAVGTMNVLPSSAFTSTLPVSAFVAVVFVAIFALQSPLIAFLNDVRAPTDAERERIERLCETAGVSPREVSVVDLDANRLATVLLTGFPGRRRLFVTTDLLADLDDSKAAAVVASKTGRATYYYREAKFGVLFAVFAPIFGLLTGELQALTGLGTGELVLGTVAFAVALLWLARRLVYAADDYAVERVGAETFVATLETLADDHQVPYESSRLLSLLLMRPPLGDRLDRLWGRVGE